VFAVSVLAIVTTILLAWAGPWMFGSTPTLPSTTPALLIDGDRVYTYRVTRTLLLTDCWLLANRTHPDVARSNTEGPIASLGDLPSWAPAIGTETAFIAQAGGFPLRALKLVQRDLKHELAISVPSNLGFKMYRDLPVGVIWWGFLADLVFWWLVWAGIFAAPGWIVRRRRLRQGHCAACGYDLAGAGALCPECGASR
jgi:hypothetical protein